MKPKHLQNYTQHAISVFDEAKYKYYGFKKKYSQNPNRALNTWLGMGFGMLFERKLDNRQIEMLKTFILKYKNAQDAYANATNNKNARRSWNIINSYYIDADGYIGIRKICASPEDDHPIETKRLESLLKEKQLIKKAVDEVIKEIK